MRIAAYLWSAPPVRTVGGEMMTLRLMQYLHDQGHDVSVVVREFDTEGRFGDVPLIPGHTISNQEAIHVFHTCDVLITHPELVTQPSRYTARLTRVPWIGIVHNLSTTTLRGMLLKPEMHVVANSHRTARLLIEKGVVGTRSITVVYPPSSPPKPPVSGLPQAFCTMVNISPDKGAETLHGLVDDLPETIQFLTVLGGHGEQDPPKGKPNVTPFGHFSGLGLPYGLTRVLISPSRDETYGMVVTEATSLGIPVVASDIEAHREALGEDAILIDPDDRDAWASAVYTLMTDDDAWLEASSAAEKYARVLRKREEASFAKWGKLVERVVNSHQSS